MLQLLRQHFASLCTLMSQRRLLSLNLMIQPLLPSNFSSAASSPLSAFKELKKVRVLPWIRLWCKGMLWLVWSSIQTTQTFPMWAIKLFRFLTHVFTGAALSISFKNLSSAFTTWLTAWHKRPSFQPISAFEVPSPLSLIISSFWFKVRDVQLLLSLEHLEATVGLLSGWLSILLCLREEKRPRHIISLTSLFNNNNNKLQGI